MRALFLGIDTALEIYLWIVLAVAVFYWLIDFSVITTRHRAVAFIGTILRPITEPLLRPLRRILPKLGTVDISPIVLIIILIAVRYVIALLILTRL